MALRMTTGEIPKDAIPLSRAEAVEYQWKQIKNWPKSSEVWPFEYGVYGLGALAATTGLYINNHVRAKLKLRHHAFLSTMVPMVLGPSVFSSVLHIQLVSSDLFLKDTKCSLCLQQRAATILIGCGIVYPIVLSPIANFMFATRFGTYRIPYWNCFRETFDLWLKIIRPIGKKIIFIACVQALAAGYVTYAAAESLVKVQSKFLKPRDDDEIKKTSPVRQ